MSIVLLPNNVWTSSAQADVTDLSDVSVSADSANAENFAGGPRSLSFVSSGTGGIRTVYVNKSGTLAATHVVLARADLHTGMGVDVRSWSSYPSTFIQEYSFPTFGETLVGKRSQDLVKTLSVSSKQALGMSFTSTYTKTIGKMFFSNGVTLPYSQQVQIRHLGFPSRYTYRRQMYLVDEEWRFAFAGLSRAEVQAFEAIPNLMSEPMFVYDSTGTQIPYYLIHGIIVDRHVASFADDMHTLTFTMDALRQWA